MDGHEETLGLILAERPFLTRLALSLTQQAADADDLVQETVLRAIRARHRFRPGTCMTAWLATILTRAHRTVVRTWNRRATRSWTDTGFDPDEARSGTSGDEHDRAEGADLRAVEQELDDDVRRALLELPAQMREPFCLHALQGLPSTAIARRLGVPPGTVMSRVFRARARLRTALALSGFDPRFCAPSPPTRRRVRNAG